MSESCRLRRDGGYGVCTDDAELEQPHDADYAAFKDLREETQILWKIKSHIDAALKTREKETTQTHEQSI